MPEPPCLDCKGKYNAVSENVCSKCASTLCNKCWKKAGNALLWSNMMLFPGIGAALFSSGKDRYKCKFCRAKSDLVGIAVVFVLLGGLIGYAWYSTSM